MFYVLVYAFLGDIVLVDELQARVNDELRTLEGNVEIQGFLSKSVKATILGVYSYCGIT